MKKYLWLVVLLTSSLSLGYALASERLDEMVEQIEAQVEDSNEQSLFVEAVEDYIQTRDNILTALKISIENDDEGDMQAEWESVIANLSDLPGLSDLSGSLSSDAAKELYDQFMDEEQAWVSALSVLETAAYRDDLVALRIRLATMTELLETKWQGFLNDDGQLDEKQWKVMADIYGILAALARDSDGKRQVIRNNIQIVTDLLAKTNVLSGVVPGEIASAVSQATGIIAETAKTYNQYKTALESLRPQLQELIGKELGLFVIFGETRKDTQLFVNENGYDIMKAHYGEAESELKSFAGVGTSGQRDDAAAFVNDTLNLLSRHVSEGKEIFDDFVTKHELKFFGPVGPDIQEYLVETEVWRTEADKARNLDRFLSALRDDTNTFFNVSLSVDGITDYEREYFEDEFSEDMGALKKAIEDNYAIFSNDNLSLIYDRRSVVEAIK
jgi:hypothetical protein